MKTCECGRPLSFPYPMLVNGKIHAVCLDCCLALLGKQKADYKKRMKAHVISK